MLRVLSDIFKALDRGDLVALTLLDLSAAFDKVDHATLIRRLEISYGINCVDLRWLSPYLQLRVQHVRCSGSRSTPSVLLCGVPPGSVLGPITFLLYIADLVQLIEKTGLYPHLYADDLPPDRHAIATCSRGHMHQRRILVDEVQPSTAEH